MLIFPLAVIGEDACITVIELEGDAQYWRGESDIIGVDVYDTSTFDHEEIVELSVDGQSVVDTSIPSSHQQEPSNSANSAGTLE